MYQNPPEICDFLPRVRTGHHRSSSQENALKRRLKDTSSRPIEEKWEDKPLGKVVVYNIFVLIT